MTGLPNISSCLFRRYDLKNGKGRLTDDVCFDKCMLLHSSLGEIVVDDFVSGRAEGKRQTSRQVCQVSYTGSTVWLVRSRKST